jgi:hypothetical protein
MALIFVRSFAAIRQHRYFSGDPSTSHCCRKASLRMTGFDWAATSNYSDEKTEAPLYHCAFVFSIGLCLLVLDFSVFEHRKKKEF